MPMEPAIERGLSIQGGGMRSMKSLSLRWFSTWMNAGTGSPLGGSARAHRQLVAEVARGGLSHARHAQVLAQDRRRLHVELVEGDDAVDVLGLRHVAEAEHHVVDVPGLVDIGNVEDFVDALARPGGVFQAVRGDQQHAAALAPALLQEFGALVIACQADNRYLRRRSRIR